MLQLLPKEPVAMLVRFGTERWWHRFTMNVARTIHESFILGQSRTACGKRIAGYYATIPESYDVGEVGLCKDGCFAIYELELAQLALDSRRESEKLERESFETEHREFMDGLAENRKRDRERLEFNTGRMVKLSRTFWVVQRIGTLDYLIDSCAGGVWGPIEQAEEFASEIEANRALEASDIEDLVSVVKVEEPGA